MVAKVAEQATVEYAGQTSDVAAAVSGSGKVYIGDAGEMRHVHLKQASHKREETPLPQELIDDLQTRLGDDVALKSVGAGNLAFEVTSTTLPADELYQKADAAIQAIASERAPEQKHTDVAGQKSGWVDRTDAAGALEAKLRGAVEKGANDGGLEISDDQVTHIVESLTAALGKQRG